MATSRPLIRVFGGDDAKPTGTLLMPSVFNAPLRPDLVRYVYTNVSKNKRQAYGVFQRAGHETAAGSWGTGRAVARVPRVHGSGSHRSAQGAFANFCRGGHMFNPNRTWRRWNRKVNKGEKRYAVASAIAASALPPLVTARGHEIDMIPELPLVIDNNASNIKTTKNALKLLNSLGLKDELNKIEKSKKLRAGRGKLRGRKYTMRKGPLFVYSGNENIKRAVRNIPGCEICDVEKLNVMFLAPGGVLGRFCIYTENAIKRLQELFGRIVVGSGKAASEARLKKNFRLPQPIMSNADINRIINSDSIQNVLKKMKKPSKKSLVKKNILTNFAAKCRVNPAAKRMMKRSVLKQSVGTTLHESTQKRKAARKAIGKKLRPNSLKIYHDIMHSLAEKRLAEAEKVRLEKEAYLKATNDM